MNHPVIFFEVVGNDGVGLRKFYTDLFGWTMTEFDGPNNYGIVEASSAGIAGGIGSDPAFPDGHTTFYVYAEDPQSVLDRAASLGGHTLLPPTVMPSGGTIAVLADPEGHPVGVYHPVTQ